MKRGNGLLAATKTKQALSFKAYLNDTLLAKEGTASLALGTFLDGADFDSKVAYTSYSRSGNTLFRKLLEQTTGVFTGSDGDLNYSLHY
jgi:hypothetical protein